MSEKKEGKLKKVFRHPLFYWILLWSALGLVLTLIFKKLGMESAQATAWQIANFLILLTTLYYFAREPLRDYLAQRRKEISGSIEEAEKMAKNSEQSYQDYEYKMEWIEDEITGIQSQIREEGERERERLLKEAQKQIERIKNEAEFTARQELKTAEARLKQEAIQGALRVAEEILKSRLTEQEEARLLEEYLAEVARGGQG